MCHLIGNSGELERKRNEKEEHKTKKKEGHKN